MDVLDGKREAFVPKSVQAADIAARVTDDAGLLQQQASREPDSESYALSAGDSRNNRSVRQDILQSSCSLLARQQCPQFLLPCSPVLIFFHPLTAGSKHIGGIKEEFCCGAQPPHIFVLKAAFFQQGVRPA